MPGAGVQAIDFSLLGFGLFLLADWLLGSPVLRIRGVFTRPDQTPVQRRVEVVVGLLLIGIWLGISGLALLGIRL